MGKDVISQNAEIRLEGLGNLNRICSESGRENRRAKKARLLVSRKLFALI